MASPVVVAFFKAQHGSWISRLYAWWRGSEYSHAELLLDRFTWYRFECGSSRFEGGVDLQSRELDPLSWDCWELSDTSPRYVRAWFDANRGKRVGWWGAQACVAALGWTDPHRFDVPTFASIVRRFGRPVAMQEVHIDQLGGPD